MPRRSYLALIVFAALMLLWEWGAQQGGVLSLVLVPFGALWHTARSLLGSGELWLNYRMSLERVLGGFLLGSALGFALGAALALSRWLNAVIGPIFNAIRQVPIFGWIPLIGMWCGLGETAKIVIIVLAALYPVTLHCYEGLSRRPAAYIEVAALFRLSPLQILLRIQIPQALPTILTGLKHGLSFSWMAVVGAELFMSASPGIGGLMGNARLVMRTDIILLAMLIIGVTGFLMNAGMSLIERYCLRWRPVYPG